MRLQRNGSKVRRSAQQVVATAVTCDARTVNGRRARECTTLLVEARQRIVFTQKGYDRTALIPIVAPLGHESGGHASQITRDAKTPVGQRIHVQLGRCFFGVTQFSQRPDFVGQRRHARRLAVKKFLQLTHDRSCSLRLHADLVQQRLVAL